MGSRTQFFLGFQKKIISSFSSFNLAELQICKLTYFHGNNPNFQNSWWHSGTKFTDSYNNPKNGKNLAFSHIGVILDSDNRF